MRDGNGPLLECDWIGPGQRELERVLGNGTRLSYLDATGTMDIGYDAVQRIARLRHLLPDGVTAFVDREYGYNRANMRTFERRLDDSGFTDRYGYDSLYRVTATALDQDADAAEGARAVSDITYLFDGVGNRRQVDRVTTSSGNESDTYIVNEMNEYTTVAGTARVHDNNGNLVDDGSRTYAYDYRNRLVRAAARDTGLVVAEYLYHADNRRARKSVFDSVDGALRDETAYFYDGWQVCEEQNGATGDTEATYVWSPLAIDELVQFERTAAHSLGAGTFYAHQNARGDVVTMTDAGGTVVESFRYDDFGNRNFGNGNAPSTTGNPYGFQGRRFDPETGLHYFRNRYYNPATGRFLERDPVWDGLNVGNQYTFAGNGPATRKDPYGTSTLVFVNSRDLAHKGSQGVTIAFPDVCKTPSPGGPVPIPYPNTSMVAPNKAPRVSGSVMIRSRTYYLSTYAPAFTANRGGDFHTYVSKLAEVDMLNPRRNGSSRATGRHSGSGVLSFELLDPSGSVLLPKPASVPKLQMPSLGGPAIKNATLNPPPSLYPPHKASGATVTPTTLSWPPVATSGLNSSESALIESRKAAAQSDYLRQFVQSRSPGNLPVVR